LGAQASALKHPGEPEALAVARVGLPQNTRSGVLGDGGRTLLGAHFESFPV